MIGIYKIISPTGKFYVGQSVDIKRRFRDYNHKLGRGQTKLHRSILKYGIENHVFDILELCNINELNDRERYYQDLYNVLENGLNCKLTTTNTKTGRYSEETKAIISIKGKGKIMSIESRLKISKSTKGKVLSEYTKAKLSIQKTGLLNPMSGKSKEKHHNFGKKWTCKKQKECRKIIDTNTGIIYESSYHASLKLNIGRSTINKYVLGYNDKITNFKYYEDKK